MATASYFTKHKTGVVVYHAGKSFAASNGHPFYEDVLKALAKKDYDGAVDYLDVRGALNKATEFLPRLAFRDGTMFYKNVKTGVEECAEGPLCDRVLSVLKSGKLTAKQCEPLMLLLDNVMKNELKAIRDELYQFLMAGDMPITKDGCFIAYKKVNSNFKDIHSGTMDNSPGKLVSMDPNLVDRNRNNHCSVGLHFAARSYLSSYGGSDSDTKVVAVKVNPRNVFAIPTDYNYAKGRCSEYYVVGEIKTHEKEPAFLEAFIFDENKEQVAPNIEFVPTGLSVPLEARGDSYGLVRDGKAWVRTKNSKGGLDVDSYVIVRYDEKKDTYTDTRTGKPVDPEHVKLLSVQTKSVRSALARAVAKARKSLR